MWTSATASTSGCGTSTPRRKRCPSGLAYIYVVDGWAAVAYDTYLKYVDPVTKWHLQTILHDEKFHVEFGQKMAAKYVTSEQDREMLQREEEKIQKILAEVTDGFLRAEV